jgi:HKD family nuclease
MISAREFCREPGYPTTVFLSYSFDPLFFERIPLGDLDKGGTRCIVIAADAFQISEAMRRCIGQVVHLGRRYVLAETASANTFHPKLIARLSPTGGRIWVGSGNLTYTGWGGNQELATAWSIGPKEEDKGNWLDELLDAVSSLIRSTTFAAQVEAIRGSVPWLKPSSVTPEKSSVLFGMPDRPLAPQLAERWKDRRFEDLKLCTGSTDTEGAFLSWAHRTFGIERATICLNPAFASFNPARIAQLPFDVRIIRANPDRLMHAKFYWFSGSDGNAALVGSANCSAAAWLTGRGYGNAELIVPYDEAREADFKSILKLFGGEKLAPEKALIAEPPHTGRTDATESVPYRIVSLRLRSAGRIIETIIEPSIPASSQVNLALHGASRTISISLSPHAKATRCWRAPIVATRDCAVLATA